jgi:hypothetical protein
MEAERERSRAMRGGAMGEPGGARGESGGARGWHGERRGSWTCRWWWEEGGPVGWRRLAPGADADPRGMGGHPGRIDAVNGIGGPIIRRSRLRERDERVSAPGPWGNRVVRDRSCRGRPSRPSAGDWPIACRERSTLSRLGECSNRPDRPGTCRLREANGGTRITGRAEHRDV